MLKNSVKPLPFELGLCDAQMSKNYSTILRVNTRMLTAGNGKKSWGMNRKEQ
jgi:hypothetical protein